MGWTGISIHAGQSQGRRTIHHDPRSGGVLGNRSEPDVMRGDKAGIPNRLGNERCISSREMHGRESQDQSAARGGNGTDLLTIANQQIAKLRNAPGRGGSTPPAQPCGMTRGVWRGWGGAAVTVKGRAGAR